MYEFKPAPRLDLEALHTFVVVAQLHSFSAAAELLHKTTSAISYRIKTLEDGVGVELIKRTTRSVCLTPSGEMLLEKASQIFELQQTIPEELQQIRDGVEPQFTIVINNLLYDPLGAAQLLGHLHDLFPHTSITIKQSVYMGVWDAMRYGGGHIAIGAPGFHTISDDFTTDPIGAIQWILVSSIDHPIAGQNTPVTLDILRHHPVINIEDTSLHLQKRSPWRLSGQQELIVPDLETKISCHIAGLGIGFLPASIAYEAIRKHQLVEIKMASGNRQPSPLSVVWRSKDSGKICQHLRDLIRSRHKISLPFLNRLSTSNEAIDAEA